MIFREGRTKAVGTITRLHHEIEGRSSHNMRQSKQHKALMHHRAQVGVSFFRVSCFPCFVLVDFVCCCDLYRALCCPEFQGCDGLNRIELFLISRIFLSYWRQYKGPRKIALFPEIHKIGRKVQENREKVTKYNPFVKKIPKKLSTCQNLYL